MPSAGAPAGRVVNAMTVDVEDWFQVQAFAGTIAREAWDTLPRRVEANTDRILDLFTRSGVRATFFTLGWVAERHPALIRRIVAAGHELASHGHMHELVHAIGPERFRADIARARATLEDAGGVRVIGYRAPTFSIGPASAPWAHAILAETGYAYSSSIFPVKHDLYGAPDAPRGPHKPDTSGVVELPMTTVRLGARNLPCSGGGWFRLFPYALFRRGLARVNTVERRPGIFYFHPWEIDPAQPRVAEAPRLSRFRHYTGMASMAARVGRLLADFSWGRMDAVFADAITTTTTAGATARP
jgi:polysaccharide deacetylase family protein (PEP-CTERM system associated)